MIEEYTSSVYSALLMDLAAVEYKKLTSVVVRRPYMHELEVYSFPQTWGSTALGFGGVGGQAFTTALTVIVIHNHEACVYFGGRFAYRIAKFNSKLFEDISARDIHEVAGAQERYSYGSKS